MAGRDEHGIKTGYYNFQVKLKVSEEGDLKHLPPTIQIGAIRGIIFYSGQPKMCRKCEQEGHVAADCKQEKCKNCGELGHLTRNCREKIMCHLCGEKTHSFRSCPLSYEKCKNCGELGHLTRNCREKIMCHLCGEKTHSFRSCPLSYRKGGTGDQESTTF
uniref:CCHC-type domain-containing protein n=1 Tax=Erpetoichthys calabaricus TaxID=27687 RepID=A0A8C4TFR4_ERPCA